MGWGKPTIPERCILVGNPGTGKSTTSNALAGKAVFKNGTSFGSGLTVELQVYHISPSRSICDTPGLSDAMLRKKAGQSIEDALKMDGHCKIVFVVTLSSGRVRPDDATTIALVLNAIQADVSFAIVLNKLEDEVFLDQE